MSEEKSTLMLHGSIDELSPAEIAAPPAPGGELLEGDQTVKIHGEDVPLSRLKELRDPACNCSDYGLRVQGRKFTVGKVRLIWNVCHCAMTAYMRQRAKAEGAPVMVDEGLAYEASVRVAREVKEVERRQKWKTEKLERLEGQLTKDREALDAERARAKAELAELEAAIVGVTTADIADAAQQDNIREAMGELEKEVASIDRQVLALQRMREAILAQHQMGSDALAALQRTRSDRISKNAGAISAVEMRRARNAAREKPLLAEVEKTERRVREHRMRQGLPEAST